MLRSSKDTRNVRKSRVNNITNLADHLVLIATVVQTEREKAISLNEIKKVLGIESS